MSVSKVMGFQDSHYGNVLFLRKASMLICRTGTEVDTFIVRDTSLAPGSKPFLAHWLIYFFQFGNVTFNMLDYAFVVSSAVVPRIILKRMSYSVDFLLLFDLYYL